MQGYKPNERRMNMLKMHLDLAAAVADAAGVLLSQRI
jgi:hypothetical protein